MGLGLPPELVESVNSKANSLAVDTLSCAKSSIGHLH